MNPSQREGWPASGQAGLGGRSNEQSPHNPTQSTNYTANAQTHQQQSQQGPLLPPPAGQSYYAPHSQPSNSLPGLPGVGHQSPGALHHAHTAVAPHEHHPPQAQSGFPPSGQTSQAHLYDREREAEVREMEHRRRQQQQQQQQQQDEAQDREQREQQTPQHSHAEPMTIHQPVAQRSSAHAQNGLLSMGVAGGSYSGPGPQFEQRAPVSGPAPSNMNQTAAALFTPQPGAPPGVPAVAPGQQPILNDALSYLDQVKVQFAPEPHVYNQFLDIMKDFKSQAIDTPGVIQRVSHLFRGHPALISGFNTFLPPGYRIECTNDGNPDGIRVTTPEGTIVNTAGKAIRDASPGADVNGTDGQRDLYRPISVYDVQRPNDAADSLLSPPNRSQGLAGYGSNATGGESRLSPLPAGQITGEAKLGQNANLLARQQEQQGVSQLQAASVAAGDAAAQAPGLSPLVDTTGTIGGALGAQGDKRGPVEFNHAISYVNKIKNRFASQPEIYKQFLEILQTYQRESKPIQDVYKQVTLLFGGAPDLLEDFKQFLPESAAHAKAQANAREAANMTIHSELRGAYAPVPHHTPRPEHRIPPTGQFTVTPSMGRDTKRKRQGRDGSAVPAPEYGVPPARNGLPPNKRAKQSQGPQSTAKYAAAVEAPDVPPNLVPAVPSPWAPTTTTAASPDELQFFDRVKKHLANKSTMADFLKLCNLYSQDLIDRNSLVFRASMFLKGNPELLDYFKDFVQFDDKNFVIENRARPASGRVNLNNCRSLGQSYRQIPKRERNKACSGRDELCRSVLNDDWVSHPTWASEDSGFIAHRKNNHEEALHRIEEERHDYDHHISNVDRTIQILEPLNQTISLMKPEERNGWQLPPDFAGQSQPIYRKILAKLYGREIAKQIMKDTSARPAHVIPVILNRCKEVLESWKASQREWEKVWREQTQRAFWRSLDHQGVNVKVQDKRQFQAKTLQNEIQVKYEEQKRARISGYRNVPRIQMTQKADDEDVIIDASCLLLRYAETNFTNEHPRLTPLVKEFIPAFFGLDLADFQNKLERNLEETMPMSPESLDDENDTSEGSIAGKTQKTKRNGGDLRKNVLEKRSGKTKSDHEDSNASESRPGSPKSDAQLETAPATEDESGEDVVPRPWVRHGPPFNKGKKKYDANEKYHRDSFNLYGNHSIYCFFRMFLILYERLSNLKSNESSVHETVRRAKLAKPAVELKMNEKLPSELFIDTAAQTDYYRQMLRKFHEIVNSGDSQDMGQVEEILRRYYLQNGWMLYTFDKLMSALVRFAITLASNDTKDASWKILEYFTKDRKKKETTYQEELTYRKNCEKTIKEGDVYRISWNESNKTTNIRLLKREDNNSFEAASEDEGLMTKDQRWAAYITSYTNSDPTEGVEQHKLTPVYIPRSLREVLKQAQETLNAAADRDEADSTIGAEDVALINRLNFHEGLTIKIDPDQYILYYGEKPYGDGNSGEEWWYGFSKIAENKTGPVSNGGAPAPSGDADETAATAAASGDAPAQSVEQEDEAAEPATRDVFDEKYHINSPWMRGLSRDDVEAANREISEMQGDVAMADA